MDKELFQRACEKVLNKENRMSNGIGTLGEKTLHSVLKNYFEPDENRHEIRIAGYVADIAADNGIIEIQTRNLGKMQKKLECFLARTNVTIVYPVAATKWLLWIDEATGEITKKRRSPKIGKPYEAFYELYFLRNLLCHPHLNICVVLLELEEYRTLNGWSKDKKKGSTRYDRIPVDIIEELFISCPEDYMKLIPEALDTSFTVKDFKAASGLSLRTAGLALTVLYTIGAVARIGKKGNAFVYERKYSCAG